MPKTQEKLTGTAILSKLDLWREADYYDSLDRAELRRWYKGGPLELTEEDEDSLGDQNFLLGYRFISKAFTELYSHYSRGRGIVQLKVLESEDGAARRRFVGEVAQKELNRILKKSSRLKTPYREACGNSVLFGTPFLYRIDPYDWCPISDGMPVMPRNAPLDIHSDQFLEWGFRAELSARYLYDQLQYADRREKSGGTARWSKAAIYDMLAMLFESQNTGAAQFFVPREKTPEELEEEFANNAEYSNMLDTGIPVYWFFRKRIDRGGKVDLYCISRFGEHVLDGPRGQGVTITRKNRSSRDNLATDPLLFYEEGRFESIDECLFPFLLDVAPGGTLWMHQVIGLGRLNYDLDRKVAALINQGLAGIEDDFTPIYLAQDTASIDKLDQFMQQGIPRNGLLPAGIQPAEKGHRVRNYQQLFSMTGFFTEAQSVNAAAFNSPPSGTSRNELEVQALERQAEAQRSTINRMVDWVESGDVLIRAIYAIFTSENLIPTDRAYPEVKEFQDRMEELGISMEELAPAVVEVQMQRLFGAGDRSIALSILRELKADIQSFPPRAQQFIQREYTAVLTDDYEMAYEMIPEEPEQDLGQVMQAQSETNTALVQQVVPPVQDSDQNALHFQEHGRGLTTFLQSRQSEGLSDSDVRGVQAVLAHMVIHARIVAGNDQQALRGLMKALEPFAKAAEQMHRPPPAPPEQVKMQLDAQKVALAERKQGVQEQQWQRSQQLREDMAEHTQAVQLNQEARADRKVADESVNQARDRLERRQEAREDRAMEIARQSQPKAPTERPES